MSKRAKIIAKLKEYIRSQIVRELEEASTTYSAGVAPGGPGHYFTPYAFRGKRKKDKEKLKKITRAGGYKPVNESQPFADFPKFPKLNKDQQESLDELFGFAESYQIFNSFNSNPKQFIKTLDDMAKIRKASNKQPKGVSFNKGKKEFVKEVMRPAVKKLLKQKGYGPIFQAIDNSKRQFKQMKYSRGEIQDTLIGMFGNEDPKILQKINESINEATALNDPSVGTKNYKGVGWFWTNDDWKHYLRNVENAGRKEVHDLWLKARFPLKKTKSGQKYFDMKDNYQKRKAYAIVDKLDRSKKYKMESINEMSAKSKKIINKLNKKEKEMFMDMIDIMGFDQVMADYKKDKKAFKQALKDMSEGFASAAQRRAAFASGYKAKGKKKKKNENVIQEKFSVKSSKDYFDNLDQATNLIIKQVH